MAIRVAVPEEKFQVVLSNEQKEQLAKGELKSMIKKDGSLIAKGMTDYFTQMQMAQIAEEIKYVQIAVEEVCKGQELSLIHI